MKTIQFGLAEKYDSGQHCSVAMNATLAIEVHKSQASSDLWYHLGHPDGATVRWGRSQRYSKGAHPSVAINSNGVLLEVHETSNLIKKTMYSKVGLLNGGSVDWGEDQEYEEGKRPSIAIDDQGIVVEVHQAPSSSELFYRLGQVRDKGVDWGASHHYDSGVQPSVAVTNQGLVVETHRSASGSKLHYRVGNILGDTIDWGESQVYQDGVNPSVAITDEGWVVEVHESQGITGLWQMIGRVQGRMIDWGPSSNFDSGGNPKVAVTRDGSLALQVHGGSMSGMWYSSGRLMDSAKFLEDRLDQIADLPLNRMVLPASHDAGMYLSGLALAGKTQDLDLYGQLSAGVRYFDLRLDGKLRIRHGIVVGPDLDEVLGSVSRFLAEGHRELVLLKFSHFKDFDSSAYEEMRRLVREYLGNWLYRSKPEHSRLAEVKMGDYLREGGSVLILIDEDWAIQDPEAGFWVYRDWSADFPQQGDLTVYDQYSDTPRLEYMREDQLRKLRVFDGCCEKDSATPCDLFLLSWTLTPPTGVWEFAQQANRILGREMTEMTDPNPKGFFPNLLYLDYVQTARPAFVAELMLTRFSETSLTSVKAT